MWEDCPVFWTGTYNISVIKTLICNNMDQRQWLHLLKSMEIIFTLGKENVLPSGSWAGRESSYYSIYNEPVSLALWSEPGSWVKPHSQYKQTTQFIWDWTKTTSSQGSWCSCFGRHPSEIRVYNYLNKWTKRRESRLNELWTNERASVKTA